MKFIKSKNCAPDFLFSLAFSGFASNNSFVVSVKANSGSKLGCTKGKMKTTQQNVEFKNFQNF